MIQTNWHVITGGPSSGKTTLIEHLAAQNFSILSEVARDYMEDLLAKQLSLADIQKNNAGLQRSILARALKREKILDPQQLLFFDRGTVDSLGYFKFHALNITSEESLCQRHLYKKIFFCAPLPLVQDAIRVEDSASAERIGACIHEAYVRLGYAIIELPATSVEERLSIVLSHLK